MSKRSLIETIAWLSSRWRIADQTAPLTPSPSRPKALQPGEQWGQFQIVEKLGHGAFGDVYHARDRLDRDVALKILDGPEAIREGKTLAKLQHPNLVAVHGYEENADGAALSLELIQGQTLETFARERGRLDPAHASLMCLQVCRGLAFVHGKGLVHRDIKAGNVMRQADGRIVLVDFGLGQEIDPDNASGEAAGTLPYMAPELFRGAPASPSTDLYAAGVLLYHLVTLAYPVSAANAAEFQQAHAAGRRNHLLDARPDLPEAFIAVVEKATDPDPAKRFRSAGAMALALEQVVESKPWSSRRSGSSAPDRARTMTRPSRPGWRGSPDSGPAGRWRWGQESEPVIRRTSLSPWLPSSRCPPPSCPACNRWSCSPSTSSWRASA